jgi:Tfp pilus assembly protein PilN
MNWAQDNIDFLPERIRTARTRRRRIAREAYLLALCLGGLVVLGSIRHERVAVARAEAASLDERQANIARQIEFRRQLEGQQKALAVMKTITTDLGSRTNVLDVLGELDAVMPRGISLLDLSLETVEVHTPVDTTYQDSKPRLAVGSPARTELTEKRIQLTVTGLSPTDIEIANFIGQLSASPLFEDVNMGYARTEDFEGRVARRFQASCLVAR